MRAFAAGGRPEVRAATKRPVDRRRKKPGPERFFSPHDFEALILTPGLTGLRVSGVNFRPAGPSRLAGARSARPPGFAPRAPYPIWVDQFQPAEVAQFSTGLDNRASARSSPPLFSRGSQPRGAASPWSVMTATRHL